MENLDLQSISDSLQPQKLKTSKERKDAALVRFCISTGVRSRELPTIKIKHCKVLTDPNTKEKTVAVSVQSCRTKQWRTVYCPFYLYNFIRTCYGNHPTLLFSRRSRKSKIGYGPLSVRNVQDIVFRVSRKHGKTPLTTELIRGAGIKALLNDVRLEAQEIIVYYDITVARFDKLCQIVYAELESEIVA